MSKHIGTLIDVAIQTDKGITINQTKAVITLENDVVRVSFDNMMITIPEEKMRELFGISEQLNQSENPTS